MYSKDLYKDKVVLVTGGRSGIGFAIAKKMLELGAIVVISSRKEPELKIASEKLASVGKCTYFACDIRVTEQIQQLAAHIKNVYGRLDILVNNAGGQYPALAEFISDKGWNAVITNNLTGTFLMTREMANSFFIPQKSGVVTNIIADIHRGFPGMVHTGAARAGVENMTKTLAQEWSEFNIRMNCIAPGIIESSGLDVYPPQVKEKFDDARNAIPMKRFGSTEDIANAVCFISGNLAAYITGVTLYVDGAQHLSFDKMGLANVMKSMLKG